MSSKYRDVILRISSLSSGESTVVKPKEGESGKVLSNRLSSAFFKAQAMEELVLPKNHRLSKKVQPNGWVRVAVVPRKNPSKKNPEVISAV